MASILILSGGGPQGDGVQVGVTGEAVSFGGATPVALPIADADQTAVTDNTGGSVADAIAAVVTAPEALVDNTGGTAAATLAAITNAANAGSADVAPVANAIAQFAVSQAANRAAIVSLTNGLAKALELINALRDALVTAGIAKGSA
jgi:hypothetical protein